MKKMTLIHRFSLLCFIALVIFGSALGWVIAESLEQNMVMRSKETIASIVSEEVKKELNAAAIATPITGPDYYEFSKMIKQLSLGSDVERIKIWNKDKIVIWSDDIRLIGQRFEDNDELNEALEDKTASEISSLKKNEQKFEHKFEKLLELYVPIHFYPSGKIDNVFEIYQNLDPLYKDIRHQKRIVWLSVMLGFTLLYFLLFGIVWRASKMIEAQTDTIVQSEERYRTLVQSALDGIVSMDAKGTLILFNKAAEMIFGYTSEEMDGNSFAMLLTDKNRSKYLDEISHYSKTSKADILSRTSETEGMRKNMQAFPMELSLSSHESKDSLVFTGIIRDISERKAIQEQLIEMERQASVATVAGSIGHELNNTVGGLLGYAELLRMNPKDADVAMRSAEIFSSQTQRLKLHAHNLLSLSKPREPEMRPLAINSLIDRVTDLLTASGVLKMLSISKKYSESLPNIMGDEMLLEQLIRNLEINAAHAMENGGFLTLATTLPENKAYVEFSVTDTGHGIPEDKLEQIFVPFYTTKEKGKGTGLGMYIVKQAIDQHKGYIRLDSEVGVGTSVIIGLPMVEIPQGTS